MTPTANPTSLPDPDTAAPDDPMARFADLFARAAATEPFDHTAVALATADETGRPSARIVLLKAYDARGFVIYSHHTGRKGREMLANPRAALDFYYPGLNEQCRVEGRVETVSDDESDAYFATRARTSQLGAWASEQSAPLDSRRTLTDRVAEYDARFQGRAVPRPPTWGGFRIVPDAIEFWRDGDFRLHDRFLYRRHDGPAAGPGPGWTVTRLNP